MPVRVECYAFYYKLHMYICVYVSNQRLLAAQCAPATMYEIRMLKKSCMPLYNDTVDLQKKLMAAMQCSTVFLY